jgi:hypothetical protein
LTRFESLGLAFEVMEGTIEKLAMSFVTVIAAIIVYRLLVKPVVPTTIQSWVGL